jgi:riboflavin biosynthesis pyrimidine reductase
LNGALLRAGLIDEIELEFFPAVIGGFNTPSLFNSPDLKPDEWPARLELLAVQQRPNGCVWLRYRVLPGSR